MADEIDEAMELLKRGKTRAAQKLLQAVLKHNPRNADATHILGLIHLQAGRLVQAQRHMEKVVRALPNLAAAHNNLGEVYRAQRKLDVAAECYNKALANDPAMADAHYNLGMVCEQQGRLEQAAHSYQSALAISATDLRTLLALSGVLRQLGKLGEAETTLRAALHQNPASATVHNNLGLLLRDAGRIEEAMAGFEQAIELDPDSFSAWSNLGVTQMLCGLFRESIASHEKAISLNPVDQRLHQNLADAYFEFGFTQKAVELYEQSITLDEDDPESHYKLSGIYRDLGRLDEATACLHTTLKLAPRHTRAYRQLVRSRKQNELTRELKTMQSLYDEPSCLPSDRIHLAFGLGKAFDDLEQYDDAFAYYREGNRLKRDSLEFSLDDAKMYFEALRLAFEQAQDRPDPSPDGPLPIFIVGMPRSGTTLIEQILAGHPDVYAAGELTDLHDVVNTVCRENGGAFPAASATFDSMTLEKCAELYRERLRLRPLGNAKRVTDKLPHNFELVGLISKAFPTASIIHVKRDPVATCFSIYTNLFDSGHGYAYDLGELGAYYKMHEALMDHWRETLPGRSHEVRYESLIENPETEVRALLEYCGLRFDRRCLDFQNTHSAAYTASAWQVRQPMYRSSIDKWQNYKTHLEPMLQALGV